MPWILLAMPRAVEGGRYNSERGDWRKTNPRVILSFANIPHREKGIGLTLW